MICSRKKMVQRQVLYTLLDAQKKYGIHRKGRCQRACLFEPLFIAPVGEAGR